MAALKSEEIDGVVVVTFLDTKILEEQRITQIGKELLDYLARAAEEKKLLVNFAGVEFMSSAMIGQLVVLNRRAQAAKVDLKFCEIAPQLYEVFKLMRLKNICVSTQAKALQGFEKKGWFG